MDMARRSVLGALGPLFASKPRPASRPGSETAGLPVLVVTTQPCPRCGLTVCFLPGQRRNQCGHCGTKVTSGLV